MQLTWQDFHFVENNLLTKKKETGMKTQASKTQTIINASVLVDVGCGVFSLLSGLESLKPADTKTQLY